MNGGFADLTRSTVTMTDLRCQKNEAEGEGGCIHALNSNIILKDTIMSGNINFSII